MIAMPGLMEIVIIAGIAVLVLGAVVTVVVVLLSRKSDEEHGTSGGGSAWIVLVVIGAIVLLLGCGGVFAMFYVALRPVAVRATVEEAAPPLGGSAPEPAEAPTESVEPQDGDES